MLWLTEKPVVGVGDVVTTGVVRNAVVIGADVVGRATQQCHFTQFLQLQLLHI